MRTTLLHSGGGARTFAVVFSTGDDPIAGLKSVAAEHGVTAAALTGIGACSGVVLGYFDWARKAYSRIEVPGQVEVLALTGNIGRSGDSVALHAHIVVGCADGSTRGGHLLEATIRPTLEVVLVESPAYLRRRIDEETGLALLDLES